MKGRILSMALLHESLYRSGTFASVDLGAYLKELATQSFRASVVRPGAVRLQLELTSVQVEMDQALPCGLLVNELIANSLKHGFPGDHTGEVRVALQPIDGGPKLRLRVSDTGVGLPADFESKRGKSLGLQLVSDMAGQIDGRLEIGPGPGAVFDVTFTPKHSEPNPSNLTASRLDGRSTR
jgi:two-component sensor histidine kinase